MIHDDLDAFENHIPDIALDLGLAVDNLVRDNSVDLLYLTSVGFFFILTIAIVSSLVTYKSIIKKPEKGGNMPTASSLFGCRDNREE